MSSFAAPILRDLVCIEVPPDKWFQLGLQLNIPKHQLDVIRANNPTNVNNCIMEMFSAWLNGAAGGVTYAELEGALIRIGLSSLAARVVQSSEGRQSNIPPVDLLYKPTVCVHSLKSSFLFMYCRNRNLNYNRTII